jgi:hypothetical protein
MFSDRHRIIFSGVPVQLIAMMITGLATRDLAVPTPPLADYPPCSFEPPQPPTAARWASATYRLARF